jgi:hypothetical protein
MNMPWSRVRAMGGGKPDILLWLGTKSLEAWNRPLFTVQKSGIFFIGSRDSNNGDVSVG